MSAPRRSKRLSDTQEQEAGNTSTRVRPRHEGKDDNDDDDDDDDAGPTVSSRGGEYTDAKMDDVDTQQDLRVSRDEPSARRATKAVHSRASRERSAGQADEQRVNLERVRLWTPGDELQVVHEMAVKPGSRAVLYWLQREQRVNDSWPLLLAAQTAEDAGLPLLVCFCMVPRFLDGTERQFGYMMRGMEELEANLRRIGLPFYVLTGFAPDVLPPFVKQHKVGAVINDFNPLRCHRQWVAATAAALDTEGVPVYRCDGHNTVPMWVASDKLETAARTIRTKIHRHLPTFLHEYPALQPPSAQHRHPLPEPVDWKAVDASLDIDRSVKQLDWVQPGEAAGLAALHDFLQQRLRHYNQRRNDPTHSVLSNMSCYLHYGMISAARCVLTAQQHRRQHGDAVASFTEELVVRRELSDNFCWHEPRYDSVHAAKPWAAQSLNAHRADRRESVYTLRQWECAVTHDELWNASQLQLTQDGKMHGFMRMYWAKKILEWSASPEQAMAFAIYLNDRYELDGRDPNGYVGIAWSMLGIHDQGWAERPVFGKIRYMNAAGCKRKFNVPAYIDLYPAARVSSAAFAQNKKRAEQMDAEDRRKAAEEHKSGSDTS